MPKKIENLVWNMEHELVLPHGNLKTPEGEYIFSCIEAHDRYPDSVHKETYIRYTWDEYMELVESGKFSGPLYTHAISYDVGKFVIMEPNAQKKN